MITESFDVLVRAEQPIIHSEGVFGNIASFRRQKYVLADGSVIRLPQVSGNAMRNGLRRAVMWHTIHLLGGEVRLGKKAVNLLFSGGTLDSESKGIDVAGYTATRIMFPPLGLFGGGLGNALVPGCLRVGGLIPICEETVVLASFPVPGHVIPQGFAPQPIAAYTDTNQGTRRELFADPKYRALLTDGEQEESIKKLTDGKKAREKGEHPEKRDSQQMIYEQECLAAGTLFHWRVGIQLATEMERSCFLSTLALYSQDAVVGGKAGVGFGKIHMEVKGVATCSPTLKTSDLPTLSVWSQYEQHIRDHGDEIVAWLRGMV